MGVAGTGAWRSCSSITRGVGAVSVAVPTSEHVSVTQPLIERGVRVFGGEAAGIDGGAGAGVGGAGSAARGGASGGAYGAF